jgi:hypothetical protein
MMSELQPWLDRVKDAASAAEVFAILDEFRPRMWTDDERSAMSRTYMAALSKLGTLAGAGDSPPSAKVAEASMDSADAEADERMAPLDAEEIGDQGPVWYEKM